MVYRHFPDKRSLLEEVHRDIIEGMIAHKLAVASGGGSAADRVREWVRLSYESFDLDPEAFTTVFLHEQADLRPSRDTRQSAAFRGLVLQGWRDAGRTIDDQSARDAALATSMFLGMLLTVPRLIRTGEIEGPAGAHARMVGDAGCRLLGLD